MMFMTVAAVLSSLFATTLVLRRRTERALPIVFLLLAAETTVFAAGRFATLRWIGLLTCVAAVAVRRLMREGHFRMPPLVVSFGAVALASAAWSIDIPLTVQRGGSYLLMLVILAQASSDLGRRAFARSWLPIIGLTALLGTAGLMTFVASGTRQQSVFANPNYFGIISMAAGLLAASEFVRRRTVMWALLCAGSFSGVAASQSRSAAIATATGLLVLAWLAPRQQLTRKGRQRRSKWSATLVAFVGIAGAYILVRERSLDGASREELWAEGLRLAATRPITGFGFGTSEVATAGQLTVGPYVEGGLIHNSWIDLLIQLGALGAILVALILITIVRSVRRCHMATRAELLPVIVGSMVSATFESWFGSVGSAVPLVFWSAVITLILRASPPEDFTGKPTGRDREWLRSQPVCR